jgi:hypothetical protein
MKTKRINFVTFFVTTIIFGILIFVTLLAAATGDEETGDDGIIVRAFEKLLYVFRFPTHTSFF